MPLGQISGSAYYFYPGINTGQLYAPPPTPLYASGSASFLGSAFVTAFGPVDISKYTNIRVSIINNSVNNLSSGSVEISPNGTNWEGVGSSSLTPLTSSGMATIQLNNLSVPYLRVRAQTSGSGGGFTGSLFVIVTANNG